MILDAISASAVEAAATAAHVRGWRSSQQQLQATVCEVLSHLRAVIGLYMVIRYNIYIYILWFRLIGYIGLCRKELAGQASRVHAPTRPSWHRPCATTMAAAAVSLALPLVSVPPVGIHRGFAPPVAARRAI